MKIALLGLPNAGKTTIFNTLTRSEAEVTSYSNAKAEPNLAVVEVGDERVTRLAEMYQPKKTTYATIDLMDFSGFTEGSAREGLFPPELMQLLRNANALAVVLRNLQKRAMLLTDNFNFIFSCLDFGLAVVVLVAMYLFEISDRLGIRFFQ